MKNEIHDDMECDKFVIEMRQNDIHGIYATRVNQMEIHIDKIEKT